MPTRNQIEALIALVERGAFVEALERCYADDASMQENGEPPRVGLPALIAHERGLLAAFEKVQARCVRPVLADGDQVVIHWVFEFATGDGKTIRLEELARQRWQGDRIAEERFFYDPVQLRP
jgi:ketosteroid isomerase-like protein